MATNFLMFYTSSDGLAYALGAGASGVYCVACVNCATVRVYTGSGEDAAGSELSLGWQWH